MPAFISGMLSMGYIVAALFFFRFWRQSRDRLFFFFALAFVILALQRVLLAASAKTAEDLSPLYLARLAAFLLILVAIIDKNRKRGKR